MEGEQVSAVQLAHLLTQRFHGSSAVEGPMSIADVCRRIQSVVQARADARAGKYRPRVNTAKIQADMDKLHICICGKLCGRHEHWSLVLWEVRSGRNGIKVRIIDPSEPENVVNLTSNLTALGIAPIVTHLDRPCDRWRCGYWCCWALETLFANMDRWQSIDVPPMPDRYEMIVRNLVLQREMQGLKRLAEKSASRRGSIGESSTSSSALLRPHSPHSPNMGVNAATAKNLAQAIDTLSCCSQDGYLTVCNNPSLYSNSPRGSPRVSPRAGILRSSPRASDAGSVSPRPGGSEMGEELVVPQDSGSLDDSTQPPSPFDGEDQRTPSDAGGHLDVSGIEANDVASTNQRSDDGDEPSSPRPEDFRTPTYTPSKNMMFEGGDNSNGNHVGMNMVMNQMMMNPVMMNMMMNMMGGANPANNGMNMFNGMPGSVAMSGASGPGGSMMSSGMEGMSGTGGGMSMMGGSTASGSKSPYDDSAFDRGFSRGNAFDSTFAPSRAGRGGRKFNIWDAYDTAFVPSPMAMMGMGMMGGMGMGGMGMNPMSMMSGMSGGVGMGGMGGMGMGMGQNQSE